MIFLVSSRSPLPLFRRPVYPSVLTIQLLASDLARKDDTFITRLPFIDHLRRLTIEVVSHIDQLSFTKSTHYDALCHVLWPLQHSTFLKRIILIVEHWNHAHLEADELEGIKTRETARLEKAFAPFLQAGTFSVQLVLLQCSSDWRQELVRCSV